MRGFSHLEVTSYSMRSYPRTSLTKFTVFLHDRYQLEPRISCQGVLHLSSIGEWLSLQTTSKSEPTNSLEILAWTYPTFTALAGCWLTLIQDIILHPLLV